MWAGQCYCKVNCISHVPFAGLIHNDDRSALLSIAHQLDVENSFGDRLSVSDSFLNKREAVVVVRTRGKEMGGARKSRGQMESMEGDKRGECSYIC